MKALLKILTSNKLAKSVKRLLDSPFAIQALALSSLMLFLMGFMPTYGWGEETGFGVEFGFNSAQAFPVSEIGFMDVYGGARTTGLEDIEIQTEDGETRIVKKRKERQTETDYVIKSGDTIPKIAHSFGLKVRSILWANELTLADELKLGNTLRIPPKDGVYYKVQKGDTMSDIASAHNITTQEILTNNGLTSAKVLTIDEEIFVPNAQKVFIAAKPDPVQKIVAVAPKAKKKYTYTSSAPASSSNNKSQPSNASLVGSSISKQGYKIIRPTKGTQTQGYHRGHLALDIAAGMNTPIYAAAPGKVITSQDGWNGGYGRYVIIDHGGGVHTLYGHNNVRKVAVGDWVEAGELIALMGNTGRVFGRTGIHLHFELRINGRKVNPHNYFRY